MLLATVPAIPPDCWDMDWMDDVPERKRTDHGGRVPVCFGGVEE